MNTTNQPAPDPVIVQHLAIPANLAQQLQTSTAETLLLLDRMDWLLSSIGHAGQQDENWADALAYIGGMWMAAEKRHQHKSALLYEAVLHAVRGENPEAGA